MPPTSVDCLRLEGFKVLVVDDNDTCAMLSYFFSEYGAQVTTVSKNSKAIRLLAEMQPDILICCPDEEEVGYGLIQQVRALRAEQGGRVPAVAITSYLNDKQAVSMGYQKHLLKPIDFDALLQAVQELTQT